MCRRPSVAERTVGRQGSTTALTRIHVKSGVRIDPVELNCYFINRTGRRRPPRIRLGIDGDGDGKFNQVLGGPDQNAFGYPSAAAVR